VKRHDPLADAGYAQLRTNQLWPDEGLRRNYLDTGTLDCDQARADQIGRAAETAPSELRAVARGHAPPRLGKPLVGDPPKLEIFMSNQYLNWLSKFRG
jgi:hypothetical protein